MALGRPEVGIWLRSRPRPAARGRKHKVKPERQMRQLDVNESQQRALRPRARRGGDKKKAPPSPAGPEVHRLGGRVSALNSLDIFVTDLMRLEKEITGSASNLARSYSRSSPMGMSASSLRDMLKVDLPSIVSSASNSSKPTASKLSAEASPSQPRSGNA
jgi:hypothetical protein